LLRNKRVLVRIRAPWGIMKIQTKLLLGFFTVSLLAVILGFIFYTRLVEVSEPLNNEIPSRIEQLSQVADLDHLAQTIRYYDEILTQSARNYAFTGDAKWKQRYYAVEPELDAVIKQAVSIGDEDDKKIFEKIDKANSSLVSKEHRNQYYR